MLQRNLFLGAVAVASFAIVACGSSSSGTSAASSSSSSASSSSSSTSSSSSSGCPMTSGSGGSAATGSSTSGSSSSSSSSSGPGTGGSAGDGGITTDAGITTDGGSDAGLSCNDQCAAESPAGYEKFAIYQLKECGCASGAACASVCADECGPPCSALTPTSACGSCLSTEGNKGISSPCTEKAGLEDCEADATCATFLACALNCPGN